MPKAKSLMEGWDFINKQKPSLPYWIVVDDVFC